MRRILLLLAALLLYSGTAQAQRVQGTNGPGEAIPVRCVNTLGTAFESCGGSGGAGTDVNISGVNGAAPAVANPLPIRISDGAAFISPLSESTFTARINTLGQKTMANSTPIVIASDQSAVPISGNISNSFLLDATFTGRNPAGASPADNESNVIATLSRVGSFTFVFDGANWDRWTGAVSGTVTTSPPANATTNVTQFGGNNVVTGTGAGGAGIPRVTISNDSTLAANQSVNVAQFGANNVATGTGASGVGVPRVTVANDSNVIVTPPTLTKGTQGSTGFSTQDLKDAGRTAISFYANAVASGTTGTETLITLTQSKGTGATSSASTYTITNAKTLRITNLTVASRGHLTATTQITTFNLRLNTGGACIVTSTPILAGMATATPATSQAWDRAQFTIPDGYEIAGNGTIALCISANAVFTTNAPTWFVNLFGYEY